MTNVLLTCAGRRNYLVNAFQNALSDDGLVCAADLNPEAPAMHDADRSFVTPPVDDPEYVDTLIDICLRNDVRLVVSLSDLELPILAAHREEFIKEDIIPVVSPPEVVDTCFDKWKCMHMLRSLGIYTAESFLSIEDARKALSDGLISFPLVIKPRWGSASIGVHHVYGDGELEPACQYARAVLSRSCLAGAGCGDPEHCLIIQEKLDGQECGMDIINDLDGNYVCTFPRRKLAMRAGETDRALTFHDGMLSEIGHRISHHLHHTGPLDCDVFVDDCGYRVLELNPRFGGGYPFSHMAGADIPAALIAWAEDRTPDPKWFDMRPDILAMKCDRLIVQSNTSDTIDLSDTISLASRISTVLTDAA